VIVINRECSRGCCACATKENLMWEEEEEKEEACEASSIGGATTE